MTETNDRRCAVVTGSTRGIGRAIAGELAAAGMNVVVNSSSVTMPLSTLVAPVGSLVSTRTCRVVAV